MIEAKGNDEAPQIHALSPWQSVLNTGDFNYDK
jgi:hypothetical protein